MKTTHAPAAKTSLIDLMYLTRRLAISEDRTPEKWVIHPEDMREIMSSEKHVRNYLLAENLSGHEHKGKLFGIPIDEKLGAVSQLVCVDGSIYSL